MKALLDTHFLVWILTDASRLADYPGLSDHRPWGISPVSVLELQYLAEIGRLELSIAKLLAALPNDPRFVLDDPPLTLLVERALPLDWTRDPFDRLLAAHSLLRRAPLCTADRAIRRHHTLLADPL